MQVVLAAINLCPSKSFERVTDESQFIVRLLLERNQDVSDTTKTGIVNGFKRAIDNVSFWKPRLEKCAEDIWKELRRESVGEI
jgi:hypothetical protein